MKTSDKGQAIGIPIRSITFPLDHDPFSDAISSTLRRSRVHSVLKRMNKLGKKAHESFSHGIKEHVKLRTTIAGIIQFGGFEKIFKQLFCTEEGEKLIKAYECSLSTTVGPIGGLLFISTQKIYFCSRKSIKLSSPNKKLLRARYKVVVPISKLKSVLQSEDVKKPKQKYIAIVTVDNFELWFSGFIDSNKAFNYLQQSKFC